MLPRKRPDLSWGDLAYAAAACLRPARGRNPQLETERRWGGPAHPLACLSVRTGFDLLLQHLAWPAGSEILVSALTIRDMVRIIGRHGLVAVPVDLDPATAAPLPAAVARAVTPRTKALLVAHLFGSRIDLDPLAAVAADHGFMLFEDCAQAFAADGYHGHPASAAVMFSFGSIKTATALGGALLECRDPAVRAGLARLQAAYPRQRRLSYAGKVLKFAVLKALTWRPLYTLFVAGCRAAGSSHEAVVTRAVRGFAGPGFFERIRRQPSAPLLDLLARRIRTYGPGHLRGRLTDAGALIDRLPRVPRPGHAAANATHWVFPILSRDPDGLIAVLAAKGIDATRGASSMAAVPAPAGAAPPDQTVTIMRQIVYLPVGCQPRPGEMVRLADWVDRFESGC